MAAVKDVRITDPYLLQQIEKHRIAAGDKSSTKTAARLLIQRMTEIESQGRFVGSGTQPSTDHDAHSSGMASAVA